MFCEAKGSIRRNDVDSRHLILGAHTEQSAFPSANFLRQVVDGFREKSVRVERAAAGLGIRRMPFAPMRRIITEAPNAVIAKIVNAST